MVPAGVDIADLAGQLEEDGVAYTAPELREDAQLNADVGQGLRDGDGAVSYTHLTLPTKRIV
mgnify:CR=1 FL=1